MADDKVAPFKVGDAYRAPVTPPAKKSQDATRVDPKVSEEHSLGFSRIEGILETEDLTSIQQRLGSLYDALHAFQDATKANKDKAAAAKAIVAIERTNELMVYLFQTKQALVAQAQSAGSGSKGGR